MNGAWLGARRRIEFFRAEAMTIDDSWGVRNYRSPFWRLYRNDSDGMLLRFAGELMPLAAGRLAIIPAGVSFGESFEREVRHFFIHFDFAGAESLTLSDLRAPSILDEIPVLELKAKTLSDSLIAGREFDLALFCRASALVCEATGEWLERLKPEDRDRIRFASRDLEPFAPALAHIDERYYEKITNRELADLCCMSESHFIRMFRRNLGVTPGDYLIDRRIRRAAQRLLFTSWSIERIATESGFGNRRSLTRAFSRRMGTGPAGYRRTATQTEGDREET